MGNWCHQVVLQWCQIGQWHVSANRLLQSGMSWFSLHPIRHLCNAHNAITMEITALRLVFFTSRNLLNQHFKWPKLFCIATFLLRVFEDKKQTIQSVISTNCRWNWRIRTRSLIWRHLHNKQDRRRCGLCGTAGDLHRHRCWCTQTDSFGEWWSWRRFRQRQGKHYERKRTYVVARWWAISSGISNTHRV